MRDPGRRGTAPWLQTVWWSQVRNVSGGSSRLEGFGVPMSKFVEVLTDLIGRTVVDKNKLLWNFQFPKLDFAPDDAAS